MVPLILGKPQFWAYDMVTWLLRVFEAQPRVDCTIGASILVCQHRGHRILGGLGCMF